MRIQLGYAMVRLGFRRLTLPLLLLGVLGLYKSYEYIQQHENLPNKEMDVSKVEAHPMEAWDGKALLQPAKDRDENTLSQQPKVNVRDFANEDRNTSQLFDRFNDLIMGSRVEYDEDTVKNESEMPSEDATKTFNALKNTEYKELGNNELAHLQEVEVEKYGSQNVFMSYKTMDTQEPIRYLPNYKNPCWYDRFGNQSNEAVLRCVPYFLVPGMPKCGSTNLFKVLQKHHQLTPSDMKEMPQFIHEYRNGYDRATKTIGKTVQCTNKDDCYHPIVTYDSTPSHLPILQRNENSESDIISWDAIKEDADFDKHTRAYTLQKFIPSAKNLVIIRDPTAKMYSGFNYFYHQSLEKFHNHVVGSINNWKTCTEKYSERRCAYTDKFSKRAKLTFGMYDIFLEDWIRVLGKDKFFIFQLEEFSVDPKSILADIFDFLDLDPMSEATLQSIEEEKPQFNKRQYVHGDMWNKTRDMLDEFYRPHLVRLSELLGDKKWMWEH